MRKTNSNGFTIIELLVVIVIIGILVALALPNLFSAQKRGRDTERKNDLKNISQQLETYYNDHTAYPDDADAVIALDGIDDLDDPKNGEYTYEALPAGCSGDCEAFTLTAVLENTDDPAAIDSSGTYVVPSVNQVD